MNKRFAYIALAGLLTAFSSCDDFLDVSPNSGFSEEYVYNSATEMRSAVNGIYSLMTESNAYGRNIESTFSPNTDVEMSAVSTNVPTVDGRDITCYEPNSTWSSLNGTWNAMYEIINFANDVIQGIEGSELYDAEGQKTAEVQWRFKRPFFMRETVRRTVTEPVDEFYYPEERENLPEPKTYETETVTLCDGVLGVRILRNLTTQERRVVPLSAAEVAGARDSAVANLGFYAVPEKGTAAFAGTRTEDGKTLNFVEYVYEGGLKILRAFDAETGAFVFTERDGDRSCDAGEKMSTNGLTFLSETRTLDGDGALKNVVKFTKISANEELPDSLFRVSLEELFSDFGADE